MIATGAFPSIRSPWPRPAPRCPRAGRQTPRPRPRSRSRAASPTATRSTPGAPTARLGVPWRPSAAPGGDTVRLTHRLPRTLQHAFPHVLQWLQEQAPGLLGDVLRPWPSLQAAQHARRPTLERLCRSPHVGAADVSTTRSAALTSAVALTTAAGAPPL